MDKLFHYKIRLNNFFNILIINGFLLLIKILLPQGIILVIQKNYE
jgi:hypothetical protein